MPAPGKACGCDGKLYDSECAANQAGVGLSMGCALPAGSFACGPFFCDVATEYCVVRMQPDETSPTGHECRSFPAACGMSPDCACIQNDVSGCFFKPACTGGASGITYSC
jgi:hypothetical protein